MKKIILYACLSMLLPLTAVADEGMWLVNTFEQTIYPQMKKKGLKLKAGEIYNEQSPALCNAIVAINGGMGTGSIISENGLVITNHHVAYGDICALSTPAKNYLETGFWALSSDEELPVKGTTVTFLRKVVDVTEEAQALREELRKKGDFNAFGMRKVYGRIEKKYAKQTPYEVECASMWRGEQFLLFYYETYRDVRLVGAPPVAIGAFGGEQDNWNWPQHKGDFALYRVYGDSEGRPADYSPENRPIQPVKVLHIATRGVQDEDYAMVIGFPGRTHRYLSSFAVREKEKVTNPIVIKSRRDHLDILKKHMEADSKVRLIYSDKYFNISNYADYAKWENICLRRYDVVGIRAQEEQELRQWIESDPARKAQYGTLLESLQRAYAARSAAVREKCYYHEAWITPSDVLLIANRLATLAWRMQRDKIESAQTGDRNIRMVEMNTRRMTKQIDTDTDKEVFKKMLRCFTDSVSRGLWGKALNEMYDRFDGNIEALVEDAYAKSCCTSIETLKAWFQTPRTAEEMLADPMVALAGSVYSKDFSERVDQIGCKAGCDIDEGEVQYLRAIYAMRRDKQQPQYPDANSTMRITYGSVCPVSPRDGVHYDFRTTIAGYTEKYNPEDYEFRVDERMRSLIAARDWGRWGEKGELYVDFLTNNDITGGNSGSPVLNGRGEVIGLAFDGNRESMSGDIYFHPTYCKTVCVDIRFVMWVIEKYAGAGKLIDEMELAK